MIYIFLVIAIVAEVIATSAMAKSDGFTRLWPSLIAFRTAYSICASPTPMSRELTLALAAEPLSVKLSIHCAA